MAPTFFFRTLSDTRAAGETHPGFSRQKPGYDHDAGTNIEAELLRWHEDLINATIAWPRE